MSVPSDWKGRFDVGFEGSLRRPALVRASDLFGVKDVPRPVGLRCRVCYLAIQSYGVRGCPWLYGPIVTQLVTLVPWWLTGWHMGHPYPAPLRITGLILLAAGAAVLIHAFTRFVIEGLGTPAPVAPTQQLVIGGLYRYVRNPMYLAVVATITGEALALCRPILLAHAAAVSAAVATFVHYYEEPTLARRYGSEYQAYRRAVPAWWPRRPRTDEKPPT